MPTLHAKTLAAIVTASCLLLPAATWAQSSGTVITTGHKGGSYFYIGRRLDTVMQTQHDIRIEVETSSGSIQNLARLADPSSKFGLALTQADALSRFLQSNPDFANEFIVLGDMGKECVILIAASKDDISSFSDLKSKAGGEISVDDPGSGASATFDYLQSMDPEFAQTRPVYVDTIEALLQMKVAGEYTHLKAAMLVQRPSTRSAPVTILLENPDHYQLIPISELDVENSTLPDGSAVYSFERVNIGKTSGDHSLDINTICTRGMLLASKSKLNRELRSKLSKSMLESAGTVSGEGK